ncbi:hypothetical protein CGRA01v4_02479 [Colletotrichum graminicola]|nr:hypothetical protein CGRA01v4_02479 [Colletotrichum graminicola]
MHCTTEGAIAYIIPVRCGVVWGHLTKNIDSLTAGHFFPIHKPSTNKQVRHSRKKPILRVSGKESRKTASSYFEPQATRGHRLTSSQSSIRRYRRAGGQDGKKGTFDKATSVSLSGWSFFPPLNPVTYWDFCGSPKRTPRSQRRTFGDRS